MIKMTGIHNSASIMIDEIDETTRDTDTTDIVCGMARGADTFGKRIGESLGLNVLKYPAEWDRYGKSAGYKRNVQMAEVADICILFPGGKGTEHMKNIATSKGLKVIEYVQTN